MSQLQSNNEIPIKISDASGNDIRPGDNTNQAIRVIGAGTSAVSGTVSANVIGMPLPVGVSGTVSANVLALPLPVGVSGTVTSQIQGFDGTNWQNLSTLVGASGTTALNTLAIVPLIFDGTNYLPIRDASVQGNNGSPAGMLANACYVWGSSSWQRWGSANNFADGAGAPSLGAVAHWLYNGVTYDRARSLQLSAGSGTVLSPSGITWTGSVYSYKNISASGTVGIKTGVGILHSVTINTKTLTAAGTLKLYDAQVGAGTLIATIDVSSAGTGSPGFLLFDCQFTTALTAVMSQNGADVTINYL